MIIAIIIVIIILILFLIQYNILTKLRIKVQQSKSVIDVYLQQRFDLIPNLVQVVKEYSSYEKETLQKIVELRIKYNETKNIEISELLNNNLNQLIATSESYPELKANEQFLILQKNLSKMENQLQAARRIYNNNVTKYNTKISVIPYNIIAKIFGFKEERLF